MANAYKAGKDMLTWRGNGVLENAIKAAHVDPKRVV